MTEEKKEEKQEEVKDPEPVLSPIEQANKAAERLEAANKAQEELLLRQEKLIAEARLGGKTFLSGKEEKKEETDEEYAMKVRNGQINPLAL